MLTHPMINPVAVEIGPLSIHWYGLTYLAAFALFWFLASSRIAHQPFARMAWAKRDVEDLLFLGVLGVIIGGRLGYCLFYKPGHYASHPIEVLYVWQGGMSFHGGLLGVIGAMAWFGLTRQRRFLDIADFVAPCVPTGLMMGRIGNFINGELWGRLADPSLPWGMIFRGAGEAPRHPSQIYQAALEGALLFVVLWWFAKKERKPGQVSAVFLLGYGVLRFISEFFREPDAHLGILNLGLTMGQWLCVPMILLGAVIWRLSKR